MKNNLNIIGYSSKSFVCIEAAETMGIKIPGYYDIKENLLNLYKLKYLAKENNIRKENQLFVSTWDNIKRKKVFEK